MNHLAVSSILAGTFFAASISCSGIINAANSPKFPGGELTAVLLTPAPHVNNADSGAAIEITFDRPILPSSVTLSSFWAFGRWSGAADGAYSFSNNDQTVTLTPSRRFSAGEQVMVILSHDLQAADGSPFRDAGLSYQFFVRAAPQPELELVEVDVMTTRTEQSVSTRSYGGFATDLNEDGWMDITIVNEDSADLRTFLNRADSTGLFHDFLTPPTSVNLRASPSEPTDFNRDGHADVCVVNINTDSVSILYGNGDGTFNPQQEITVGDAPRGIAVLDVDGDGDMDIVNTNSGSGNMSMMLNIGHGAFGPPTFFEGGGTGEFSLAAADMDNDNVLDLVIGAQSSEQILINKCNGDGTFSFVSSQSAGGETWMLVCGDLDGDGDQDVTSANSGDNNGAVLLGNGAGTLAPPTTYSTDNFPLATDVADLDGDGDLDWVTASFSGDWFLFTNDGDGTFTFNQEINAPIAASCSLAVDIDNDGDLDLALIDELADVVIIKRNGGYTAVSDSLTVTRGAYVSGGAEELAATDNADLSIQRATADTQSRTEFEIKTVSPVASPVSLDVTLEGSVFARSAVNQTIELFNYDLGQWEEIDTRAATRFTDSTVTLAATGDLSRFVEAETLCMRAKIRYASLNPRQQFASNTDQFVWTIDR